MRSFKQCLGYLNLLRNLFNIFKQMLKQTSACSLVKPLTMLDQKDDGWTGDRREERKKEREPDRQLTDREKIKRGNKGGKE